MTTTLKININDFIYCKKKLVFKHCKWFLIRLTIKYKNFYIQNVDINSSNNNC